MPRLRTVSLCAVVWSTFVFSAAAAIAAKPSPPTPPPPPPVGTIFYTGPDGFWAMNADGSQKTLVSVQSPLVHPAIIGTGPIPAYGYPCDRAYGGDSKRDRWSLCLCVTGMYDRIIIPDGREISDPNRYFHCDLFAYRSDPTDRSHLQVVQVTDFFGEGWTEPVGVTPEWSNDSNESLSTSYASSLTLDLGDCFYVDEDEFGDPVNVIDFRIDPSKWSSNSLDPVHVPVTAGEIQDAYDAGVDLNLSLYVDCEVRPFYTSAPAVSPDRTQYLSCEANKIIVRSMSTGSVIRTVWDGTRGIEPKYPTVAVWSPDGAKVAFDNGGNATNTSAGGVWTILAAGGTPVQLAKESYKSWKWTYYNDPMWSPDSNYVLMEYELRNSVSGTTVYTSDQMIVPWQGGTLTNLTADIGGATDNYRWVSNTPAP